MVYTMENGQTGRTNTPNTLNMVGKEKMSKVGQSECDAINTHDTHF